jgi:tetratricopeptide (TPR) repeat protein
MHFFGMTLELDPEDADANNNLGYTSLENGGDPHTALRLIIRAVRIRPDCGEFLDSLGWVYHRLGRTLEAMDVLRDAIDILPKERAAAEIHDHLGVVYHALGRIKDARREWMRALEINPDYHPAQLHLEESYRQKTDTR